MATAGTGSFRVPPSGSKDQGRIQSARGERIDESNAICRISLASPDQILRWSSRQRRQAEHLSNLQLGRLGEEIDPTSFGEVKKPETINYRTFKPEKDGLFCERIFGPVKDCECACGKYKRIKYKGIVCDRCGVEVTESKVRRHRMGHIKLAAPVCHIWFYRAPPAASPPARRFRPRPGQGHLFPGLHRRRPGRHPAQGQADPSEEETRKYQEVYGDRAKIMIGAEAVRELLAKIRIDEEADRLMVEMRQSDSLQKRNKIIKRLKVSRPSAPATTAPSG